MNPKQQAKMMRQLQQMQQKVAEAQEQLARETVEASAGGGIVMAVVSGDLELKEIRIQPEAVDPDDVEMLQDLVTAAVNEALRAAQDLANQRMGSATDGMQMPGMPGLF
jgi:nucleoid-associated protein EbfC